MHDYLAMISTSQEAGGQVQAQVADEQGEKIEGADGNELETPLKDDNKANLPRLSKKVLLTQRKEGDGRGMT